ncbi:MAG: L,D-transpeptidase [Candidatus Sericytochromatia bacterium]
MRRFMLSLCALMLAWPAQAESKFWGWAAPRYGMQQQADLLMPFWDAWLLHAPVPAQAPAILPKPAPPLPKLSAKAWIYISKKQQKLYLKDGDQTLLTWPVSTARYSVSTPVGRFRIINKTAEPAYHGRHGSFAPRDPKNPLGTRWVGLNVGHFRTGVPIGIHGTAEPQLIGTAVSDGCIRLRNPDVEVLFKLVPTGTTVVISDQ